MKNLAGMMKQAQQMQKNMKEVQARMDALEVEGFAGGEMVKVTMSGKSKILSVKLNPAVVDKDDIETLEDLIAVAVNDAQTKVQAAMEAEVQKATGGMSIPGMF